jgi:hypothetical protein
MNKLIRRAFLFLQDDVSIKEKARHLHSGKKKTGKAIPQHAGFGSNFHIRTAFRVLNRATNATQNRIIEKRVALWMPGKTTNATENRIIEKRVAFTALRKTANATQNRIIEKYVAFSAFFKISDATGFSNTTLYVASILTRMLRSFLFTHFYVASHLIITENYATQLLIFPIFVACTVLSGGIFAT